MALGESYPSLSAPGPPCPFSSLLYQLPTHSSEWSLKSEIKCAQPLMGETRMKKGRLTVQAITMVLTQTRAIIQRCFPGQCGVTVSWVLRLCVGQSHHRSGGFPATGGPSPLFPANNISLEPLEQLCTHLNPISAVSRCRCRTICPLCSLIAVPSGHIHQYHCDCHIWVNT